MKKNGKRWILCFIVLIIAVCFCVCLSACNEDDIKEISITPEEINVRIGEFSYSDYKIITTYNSGKTEETVLTEDMIAPKDRLKFYQEGEYEIEVKYRDFKTTVNVNVRRNVFAGATFEDLDVVYNGEFYTVEVQNVPEGTTVTYPSTNRFRTAGEYQATVILRKDAYEMKEMKATVIIRKADYDLSKVSFEDKTESFNGDSHILALEGELPIGLYVDYTIMKEGGREEKGNTARNAGDYTVTATFTGDNVNYNVVEPKQATLHIAQAEIDMSKIKFEDKTVVYDRTRQSIELTIGLPNGKLPDGVSVEYENNEYVDAGKYEATAKFSINDVINYAPIPDMKATLTIEKANYDMSGITFNGAQYIYDGFEKEIEIHGQLPTGVSLKYVGNKGTDAGSYEAKAVFTSSNVNYNDPEPLTATLVINPTVAPMDTITFERRRFISRKSEKDTYGYTDEEWEEIIAKEDEIDEDSGNRYVLDVYYYDPYLAAKEYIPENIPEGLKIASIKYKKVDGWIADLSDFDGVGEGYIDKEDLNQDGYYVVVVKFDGGKNYTGISPIKTLIRVDTISSYSTWELLVYDNKWKNLETGEVTGVFMDYYEGECVAERDRIVIKIGDNNIKYCDCNVFISYLDDGEDGLISSEDSYFSEIVLDRCSEIHKRNITGYDEIGVSVKYDDCNPFGVVAGDFGDIEELEAHTTLPKSASESMLESFESLSDLFATFMGYFNIPEDTEYIPSMFSNEAYESYLAFYAKAMDIYENSFVSFTKGLNNNYVNSAIIGLNQPYLFAFSGAVNSSTLNNYQLAIANLFGFESKNDFVECAQTLLDKYNEHRDNINNALDVNEALNNGCFYTTNESFVFPIAVKNKLDSQIVAYLIVDADDHVSIWINDINAVFWATNFNESFHSEDKVTNELYCKNRLFVTAPSYYTLAEEYIRFIKSTNFENMIAPRSIDTVDEAIFNDFLMAAEKATCPATEDSSSYEFDKEKVAYLTLNDNNDHVVITKYDGGKNVNDYYILLANIFGFVNVDDFFGADKLTGQVFDTYLNNEFLTKSGVSMDSAIEQLACVGAVYEKNGLNTTFIFPYIIQYYDDEYEGWLEEFIYLFCSEYNTAAPGQAPEMHRSYGALFSNAEEFFKIINQPHERDIYLEGRCITTELGLTRIVPMTVTVIENGIPVKHEVTDGKDILFTEQSDATSKLIYNEREIYKFVKTLPGNCSELSEGYDENDYHMSTDQVNYTFCDDDIFATVIKANGDVSTLSKRNNRDDHPQMQEAIGEYFDYLSELYWTFASKFIDSEDINNEWKIGSNNANYRAYENFFNLAKYMMGMSNRGMGKNNEYTLSESLIIGMNIEFSIAINGTNNSYTAEQYRSMVAKLFGFTDIDTFTAYTDAIAKELIKNSLKANADSISKRLMYDGAIYTKNGIFVLPYVIDSETSVKKVLAFIFVDANGTMAIWINSAKNAFNSTNFGEDVLEDIDKNIVVVNGRCLLFEDDGYVMKEDMSAKVLDMINNLQNFANNLFVEDNSMAYCYDTNYNREDDEYLISKEDANYIICDCDPFGRIINSEGDINSLTKRVDRKDYPVITQEVADNFDDLSELFHALFSNYEFSDNESMDLKVAMGEDNYYKYRRVFRYAKEMFTTAKNSFGIVGEYILSNSIIIGMNKDFAISVKGNGRDYTVEDYRVMVSKLFGFDNLETLTSYSDLLANALIENGDNANVESLDGRLIYDGAIYTTNGCYILPYAIDSDVAEAKVLAFVFVDTDGTMAIWIHNADDMVKTSNFVPEPDFNGKSVTIINGRCVLFEEGNFSGWNNSRKHLYEGAEKVRSFASTGDFLIYSPFSDEDGFEVYWFSIYSFDLKVVYEDPYSDEIGTVQKGLYTLINVASADDVRDANARRITQFEEYLETYNDWDDWDDDWDDYNDEGPEEDLGE